MEFSKFFENNMSDIGKALAKPIIDFLEGRGRLGAPLSRDFMICTRIGVKTAKELADAMQSFYDFYNLKGYDELVNKCYPDLDTKVKAKAKKLLIKRGMIDV